MRIWKPIKVDPSIRQTDAISDFLDDWLREVLATAPPGPVKVETNLGGYDEAGYLCPDFEWAEPIIREFPHLHVRATYHLPGTRQEATAPYEVRVRWAGSQRRAWVECSGPDIESSWRTEVLAIKPFFLDWPRKRGIMPQPVPRPALSTRLRAGQCVLKLLVPWDTPVVSRYPGY